MTSGPWRIVSYNVRYFGHALRGLASTRGPQRSIASSLASLDPLPDIVCLQEVETISLRSNLAFRREYRQQTQLESFMVSMEDAFARKRRAFPYEAFYFRAHTYRVRTFPLYTTGLAILVNLKSFRVDAHNVAAPEHITHHHVARFRETKQSRVCAHMRLMSPDGRPLHVFNTHLSLPTPFSREFWAVRDKMGFGVNQLHEAKSLVSFVRQNAGEEPFVVGGDFNSPPGSPLYRYLTEEVSFLGAQESLGQIDARSSRGFPTAGFLRLRMHLDHLFSGGGVNWVDLKQTAPFGDISSAFHGLSDHVPLIGRFNLAPGK